jgi:hypothetical protein
MQAGLYSVHDRHQAQEADPAGLVLVAKEQD